MAAQRVRRWRGPALTRRTEERCPLTRPSPDRVTSQARLARTAVWTPCDSAVCGARQVPVRTSEVRQLPLRGAGATRVVKSGSATPEAPMTRRAAPADHPSPGTRSNAGVPQTTVGTARRPTLRVAVLRFPSRLSRAGATQMTERV